MAGPGGYKSRSPAGSRTSIRRALTSIAVQISAASGTNNSPFAVSSASKGVPGCPSPGKYTSRTFPSTAGAAESEHGEDATAAGKAVNSNTEHPIKSVTKYIPDGITARWSYG